MVDSIINSWPSHSISLSGEQERKPTWPVHMHAAITVTTRDTIFVWKVWQIWLRVQQRLKRRAYALSYGMWRLLLTPVVLGLGLRTVLQTFQRPWCQDFCTGSLSRHRGLLKETPAWSQLPETSETRWPLICLRPWLEHSCYFPHTVFTLQIRS